MKSEEIMKRQNGFFLLVLGVCTIYDVINQPTCGERKGERLREIERQNRTEQNSYVVMSFLFSVVFMCNQCTAGLP